MIAVIPAGLTYAIQPLDVSFNRPFRQLIERLQYDLLYEETAEEDEMADDEMADDENVDVNDLIMIQDINDWTLSKRRIFMTKVVSQAYSTIHACPKLVTRSFTCTGINIEPDGSQDSLISIKGFINEQDLDISGWRTILGMKTEEIIAAAAINEPDNEPDSEPVAHIDLTAY
jgi:hypothetical protein